MPGPSPRRFVQFAWVTLGITVLVILWGAVVRATGSGAGCGSHWPLCNGVAVPLAPTTSTMIEYVHRLTSGVAMLLSVGLVIGSRRTFARGHGARRWAVATFVFMMIEAAVGAGLVLLGLVEDNASALRAGYIAVHLLNTMLLVGAMVSVIWWAKRGDEVETERRDRAPVRALTAVLAGLVLVAASGAIVALGDTLFPHDSLIEGIRADFDATAHFLIRLRLWHPVLASAVAGTLVYLVLWHPMFAGAHRAGARTLILSLVATQVAVGLVTLLLLAPLALQLTHLTLSNLLWIAVVWAWWNGTRPAGRA